MVTDYFQAIQMIPALTSLNFAEVKKTQVINSQKNQINPIFNNQQIMRHTFLWPFSEPTHMNLYLIKWYAYINVQQL